MGAYRRTFETGIGYEVTFLGHLTDRGVPTLTADLPPPPPTPIILRVAVYNRRELVAEYVQRCDLCRSLVQVAYIVEHLDWHATVGS